LQPPESRSFGLHAEHARVSAYVALLRGPAGRCYAPGARTLSAARCCTGRV